MTEQTHPVKSDRKGAKSSLRSIIGLILCSSIGFVGVWNATQYFGRELARNQTEIRAGNLHEQVVKSLSHGSGVFADQRPEIIDENFLQRFVRGGDVSSVTLFNHQGIAFWSTEPNKRGIQLEPDILKKLLTNRTPAVVQKVDSATEDSQWMHWLPFGASYSKTTPDYTGVVTPVISEGQVIGATELVIDGSRVSLFFAKRMNMAALLVGGLLAALALVAGYLANRYVRAKLESITARAVAREARKSEIVAQKLAGQLTERNEFVGQLNRLLEVNLKQLGDAQDTLVRKNRLAQMGQLTATVAHEIRNPLGALRNALYIIRQTADETRQLKRQFDIADRSIERCDTFIAELLDFTRIDKLSRQLLNVDEWILSVVEDQAQQLPAIVRIECELSARDVEASFDPDRMRRVLINMMSNASEAMVGKSSDPQDPLVSNPMIKISSQRTLRGVEFKIQDNGPGIKDEQLEKIFEPLYSTKSFGIGLGVPAMQQILQQHGGDLEYECEAGKGATAIAWFPLEHTDSQSVESASVLENFLAPDAAKSA